MKNNFIPLFAFLALFVLANPFSFGFSATIVPGWHVTIYPSSLVWAQNILTAAMFMIIGLWLRLKRADKLNFILFAIHFFLISLLLIIVKYPLIFIDVRQSNHAYLYNRILLREQLIPYTYWMFIIAQVLFIFYFIRTIRTRFI